MPEEGVDCPIHGRRTQAFVCRHIVSGLRAGMPAGFHTPSHAPDENQAWCDSCERVRAREGEWNDRSEAYADIHLICDRCFDRARKLNLVG